MSKKHVNSDRKRIIKTRHLQKGLLRAKVAENSTLDDPIQKTNDCKPRKSFFL
jgi:hypothetical protein